MNELKSGEKRILKTAEPLLPQIEKFSDADFRVLSRFGNPFRGFAMIIFDNELFYAFLVGLGLGAILGIAISGIFK